MIGILYEHPEWFLPLFAELDRRGLPFERVHGEQLSFDPASDASPFELVVNRMSPSAYLRGHQHAIFAARQYLEHLERLNVATINGARAYALELSKSRQLGLLTQLHLRAPKSRVANTPEQIIKAAQTLEFPLIVKPNIGGSGALMQRFDSSSELHQADLSTLFGIDQTAIVQEYHPPKDGSIVRVEGLDGSFLYAIRIYNDPSQGFNLCPADICQVPAVETFDNCPVDVAPKAQKRIEAENPPEWVKDAVLRIFATAGLDLGGVEYLESERDGQLYFYDINALSNFVTDAPTLVGFDPFVRLGDLIERRWHAANPSARTAVAV